MIPDSEFKRPKRARRNPKAISLCRGNFLMTLAAGLLWSTAAHAQRIPTILVAVAVIGLLAPFVAVPIKILFLRAMTAEATIGRLWLISAVEWLLWFPLVGFTFFSFGPFILALVLALSIWLHRIVVNNVSWGGAFVLSLLTPILAIALTTFAYLSAEALEGQLPSWLR